MRLKRGLLACALLLFGCSTGVSRGQWSIIHAGTVISAPESPLLHPEWHHRENPCWLCRSC